MDRQAWIAVTLCVLGLVGWQFYMASHAPPVPPAAVQPAATAEATPSPAATPLADVAPSPDASPRQSAAADAVPAPAFEEKIEELRNADVALRLTTRGGGIAEAVMLHHVAEGGDPVVINRRDRLPIGALIDPADPDALSEFQIARTPDGGVVFERLLPGGVRMVKTFAFMPSDLKDNFLVSMNVEYRNEGADAFRSDGAFVSLGSAVPVHPNDMTVYTRVVWYVDGKAKSFDVNWFPAQHYPLIGVEKRSPQEFYRETFAAADWGATSSQFFTTVVTPLTAKGNAIWGRRFEVNNDQAPALYGIEGALGLPPFELPPGQGTTFAFQIYAGPKLYAQLAKLDHGEAAIMNFGMWKLISQALLNFMNLLHSWVRDYGFAIILLTACVKGVLWPLQNKANRSMRKMSALAPHMQQLKEKHKDDPTRMNQEVMKLYKEHGVNPVSGCLPMMIQIPIFFGLFSMLGQAVELRNASFLWVSDLSQPDTVAYLPGLGWPINILPLLMGATNLWLIRMTPNTGDPMQRRVIMFMPLIFLIFCYNFAAALALYYTTQNLFTILQLWVNQRQPAPEVPKPPAPVKRSRKGR